ncbi:MAG TPA: rhodanese-like domain-containing protein [Phycisphaerae bacterium]|nr:rhodanese-like domain-containing protein [Phycisphaerae bacterium]
MPTTIQTISKEELSQKLSEHDRFQLLNVLEPEYYKEGIIRGSRKIPLSQLDRRFNELDKSQEVVVYCASHDCPASRQAAEALAAKGFDVKAYEGGIKEWKEAGLPTE